MTNPEPSRGPVRPDAAIARWLLVLWALVLIMLVIGGVTRLTGSGLSIVSWKPISGALPPLNDAAWQRELAAYQASPQFRTQNHWMALADFQRIFFWEYLHRLFGRLMGVALLVPWLWFALRKRMDRALALRTGSIFLLGGLQGFVGWYMVKSGLVNEPRVSHLRLALHLVLAVSVGQWILWQALELRAPRASLVAAPARLRHWAIGLLPLVLLQVTYGAFMAGKHAGLLFSTFPDMNGHYSPAAFLSTAPSFGDWFNDPVLIHFVHRVLGGLVAMYVGVLAYQARRASQALRNATRCLGAIALVQVVLGVLTVVLQVPIVLAVAHQAGAYLLVSAALALCHAALGSAEASNDAQASARDGGFAGARQDLRRA